MSASPLPSFAGDPSDASAPKPGTAPVLSLNGQPIAAGAAVALDPADLDAGLVISNDGREGDTHEAGGSPALVTLWQSGTPADLDQPQSQGMEIQRTMFDLETLQPVTNPAPGQRVLVSATRPRLQQRSASSCAICSAESALLVRQSEEERTRKRRARRGQNSFHFPRRQRLQSPSRSRRWCHIAGERRGHFVRACASQTLRALVRNSSLM